MLETPKLSIMAWLPMWKFLLSLGFKEVFLASCQCGSPRKKEFRLLSYGVEKEFLDVRCKGGHQHVKIEGQYTKTFGEYVDGVL